MWKIMTLVEMKSIHNKLIFHCIQIMVSVLAELKWNCQRLMGRGSYVLCFL